MAVRLISLKVPEDELKLWDEEAKRIGISRTELIRRKMEGSYIPDPQRPTKPVRSKACEHRLAPGTYCKSCGRMKT